MVLTIPIRGLSRTHGAGDVLASLLGAIGMKGWQGCNCDERRAALNRAVTFVPFEVPQKRVTPEAYRVPVEPYVPNEDLTDYGESLP